MTTRSDTVITRRAAAAVTAAASRPGPAAHTARAQIRSERHARHTRTSHPKTR